LQTLPLESEIVEHPAIVLQADERCAEDVVQVAQADVAETDPDAENRWKDD
jgi:hypothetical protein